EGLPVDVGPHAAVGLEVYREGIAGVGVARKVEHAVGEPDGGEETAALEAFRGGGRAKCGGARSSGGGTVRQQLLHAGGGLVPELLRLCGPPGQQMTDLSGR